MANPLTLLMPVIAGTDPKTIATKLAQYAADRDKALTEIGTVHYARTLLLDANTPNLQPGAAPSNRYILAVITEYDEDFDQYIVDFVNKVGDFFDALLEFVVGGAELVPVANNVAAFQAYVKANDASQQPGNTGLYQAYPYSVQEILANPPVTD
jgi:hypothetical protein